MSNIIIIALRVALFIIFTKYFKNIFFISHLNISVLLLNTFSSLKYTSLIIIILLYGGI